MENLTHINYTISIPITENISQKSPSSLEKNKNNNQQCELTSNFFDPTKSSPPNTFLKNLELRMSIYNTSKNNCNK
jgi:hypothetical protein